MKTLAFNNSVIVSPENREATFGSKYRGNLLEATSDLNKGDRFVDNHLQLDSNLEAPREDKPGFFSKIVLITLMTLLLSPFSFAQDFDANRMNRDIKIMENILDELFKLESTNRALQRNNAVAFFSGSSRQTVGTYVPGYGMIFNVPHIFTNHVSSIEVNKQGDSPRVTFVYKSDNESDSGGLTKESVSARITEFLQDYASTITQLKPDEHVMVIYGTNNSARSPLHVAGIVYQASQDSNERKPLPVLSVSATKRDLDAYRSGSINDSAFKGRVKISETLTKDRLDLKVMSNILQTALSESSEDNLFRISGKPSYLMLDGFGALFTLNVRHHRSGPIGSVVFESKDIREVIRASGVKQVDVLSPEEADEQREEREQEIKEAVDKLKMDITDYLIDYGRTLSSVNSNEHVLLTININTNWGRDTVPSRLDIQIKKSVLEQLETGKISRNNAKNAVTITEF